MLMSDAIEQKMQDLSDFRKLILTSIVTALALVVGLFWNDAIRALIEQIVPRGDTLSAKFLAAVVATIVVVFIIYVLGKWVKVAQNIRKNGLKKRKR